MVDYQIATVLVVPLAVVVPHKLGTPGNPELTIAAVVEDGSMVFDDNLGTSLGVSGDYIEE